MIADTEYITKAEKFRWKFELFAIGIMQTLPLWSKHQRRHPLCLRSIERVLTIPALFQFLLFTCCVFMQKTLLDRPTAHICASSRFPSRPSGHRVDSTLSSALRATGRQQEVGGTRWRWGARVHNSLWLNNLRLRGSMGFLVAGFLACSVWMLCPRSAKAAVATAVGSAGKGGKVGVLDFLERYRNLIIDVHYEFERTYGGDVGSRILGEVKPFAKFLDDVFIEFAERFGAVLDRLHSKQLRKQASVMFVAASQTSGVAPVAAAGLIGQPLGRTMVLTILSHTYYAVSKFQFFLFALAIKNFKGVTAKQQRENSSVKPIPKPTRRAPPSLFPKHRRRPVRPAVKPAARSTPMSKDPALIAFRNQTNTMAPKWLIVVAAFCGPSIATVSAAVALDLKLGKVMPILKSFFLGSVLGSLLAGSLCFSGAGTELAARWAVLQAMFGLPFQALLNDNLLFSWLVILYMLSQMRGKSARMQK